MASTEERAEVLIRVAHHRRLTEAQRALSHLWLTDDWRLCEDIDDPDAHAHYEVERTWLFVRNFLVLCGALTARGLAAP